MAEQSQELGLPEVALKLGGQSYTIHFGIRAILALKRQWNLPDQRAVQAKIANSSTDIEVMIDVVWAALQTHHRALTPDDVLDLLDQADLGSVTAALNEAMEAASPPKGTGSPPPGQTDTPPKI